MENGITWSKVRKGQYLQTAKETNEISDIVMEDCVPSVLDVHEDLVTMAILHGLRQGGSKMYLDHRTVLDKDQRHCTSQVLVKIQIKWSWIKQQLA